MVAYSFAPQFIEPVATLNKLQTVRGFRKRHALPGEAIQLYTAMRTKFCRKLVTPDPICRDVRHIRIALDTAHPLLISAIVVEGVALDDEEIEEFAEADGFGALLFDGWARRRMGQFWFKHHQWNIFEGVVIRWTTQNG
tara:strand:+ start:4663 stop:5079 length:417 start_codon:yes stop_codon:yes gene_type:complete